MISRLILVIVALVALASFVDAQWGGERHSYVYNLLLLGRDISAIFHSSDKDD